MFYDDLSLDVQNTFEAALAEGLDVVTATQRVLDRGVTELTDTTLAPIIYLALAALQLEHGAVQPEVRRRAMTLITTQQGIRSWSDAGPEILSRRMQALDALRIKLLESA